MAYRFYNINDAGAPQDSSAAPLPNGFARVNTFEGYKQLRERELALHRLACEVFSIHNGLATATTTTTEANGGIATVPTPAPLTRAQQRFLEDLRDLCAIPEDSTEVELIAAATNPTVQKVAGSGVAKSRAAFYDGVDDVPLEAPVYASTARVGGAAGDDGSRMAFASSSTGGARPTSPAAQGALAANGGGASAAQANAAAALVVDPTRMYMSDLANLEKEIRQLIKEVLSENTSEARRVAVHATLKDKKQTLLSLKATLSA